MKGDVITQSPRRSVDTAIVLQSLATPSRATEGIELGNGGVPVGGSKVLKERMDRGRRIKYGVTFVGGFAAKGLGTLRRGCLSMDSHRYS